MNITLGFVVESSDHRLRHSYCKDERRSVLNDGILKLIYL